MTTLTAAKREFCRSNLNESHLFCWGYFEQEYHCHYGGISSWGATDRDGETSGLLRATIGFSLSLLFFVFMDL